MAPKKGINILNTPYLIIVESPSKCQKIEKYLGFEYKCIASKGHIREIKKINYKDNYTPEFEIIKEKQKTVKELKEITSKFDKNNIFLGTDDDREGEGIAWHICQVCDLDVNKTKRIIFHEITKDALNYAVNNHIQVRMNIVNAQQCRQVLDRIIGFKISTILSKMIKHDNNKFLSAGRCQTPTLHLIYDRYKECMSKEVKMSYKIDAIFEIDRYTLKPSLNKKMDNEENVISFLNKSIYWEHKLMSFKKSAHTNVAPLPFNTSKLLQYISNTLHISPKMTMSICQKLYQTGLITYMRTEETKYSKDYIESCKLYITKKYRESYIGDTEKIENKSSTNPHEAIRVTNITVSDIEDDDSKVVNVYKAIWKRSLNSCMSDYSYEECKYIINAPEDNKYTGTIEYPIFLGWKVLDISNDTYKQEQELYYKITNLLSYYIEKKINYKKINSTITTSNIEKYFQEASLINKLESIGIGRPSTFSMLVDTIQERKYVKKMDIEGDEMEVTEYFIEENMLKKETITKTFGSSKKSLKIQELGINCTDILYEYFSELFCYEYTKNMEDELDILINDPTKKWYDICKDCDDKISKCTEDMKKKIKKKYPIDEKYSVVFGKNGPMIEYTLNSEIKYKSIKDNVQISFSKLENNEYTIDDIIEINEVYLGKHNDIDVIIKKGPYGIYVQYGETKTISLNGKYTLEETKLEDIIPLINEKPSKSNSSILRVLSKEYSVRKGKYGNYIFYKTEVMKKPIFINIKKCPHDVLKDNVENILSWVKDLNTKEKFKK